MSELLVNERRWPRGELVSYFTLRRCSQASFWDKRTDFQLFGDDGIRQKCKTAQRQQIRDHNSQNQIVICFEARILWHLAVESTHAWNEAA